MIPWYGARLQSAPFCSYGSKPHLELTQRHRGHEEGGEPQMNTDEHR